MSPQNLKLVIYVPVTHADKVRKVLGEAGAGKIGNYDFCSFSTSGTGRFRGNQESHPTIGRPGELTEVKEERIETIVPRSIIKDVIKKVKAIHPYEEMAYDVFPLENS